MIIFGINPVLESIKAGLAVKEVYVADRKDSRIREVLECAAKFGIRTVKKEKWFFRELNSPSNQSIAADINFKPLSLEKLFTADIHKKGAFMILDQIEDPRNLGAIIRGAAASDIDGVVLQSHRSCRITPTVFSASAGAIAHVKIAEIPNIKTAIRAFREEGVQVIGTDSDGLESFWEVDYTISTAFVLGSEGQGMRKTVKSLCDTIVRIPMSSKVSSLNVSVATGILLFELLRQRGSSK